MIQFLLNWPVPWFPNEIELPSFFGAVIFGLNMLNLCVILAIAMTLTADYSITIKITLKRIIFFLIWFIILPLSTTISLLIIISIILIVILVIWIFDLNIKFRNRFKLHVKCNKNTNNKYCINCKYNKYIPNSKIKCNQLEIEFSRDECPCEGKLFEKE